MLLFASTFSINPLLSCSKVIFMHTFRRARVYVSPGGKVMQLTWNSRICNMNQYRNGKQCDEMANTD